MLKERSKEELIITFENCESMIIDARSIISLRLRGIKKDLNWTYDEGFRDISRCEGFDLSLCLSGLTVDKLNRLKAYQDITYIDIAGKSFYVEWAKGSDYFDSNMNQQFDEYLGYINISA